MKLTENTVNVLKNFSTINPNLLVKEGSTITTMSAMKNILAKADVDEQFNQQFAIYDLNEFLENNGQSKLVGASQVVYFVPPEPVKDFENYSVKLTRSHGQILEVGGKFKMINKNKRDIFGINKDEASEVISAVTSGQKGPFFVSINCPTGAMNCDCH